MQTGMGLEKRLCKELKALAETKDMTLGELVEGFVLRAFEGRSPFAPETPRCIQPLRERYGMVLNAGDSHRLTETERP